MRRAVSMDGAIVDDPEDTFGAVVGVGRHDLGHQGIEGGDGGLLGDLAEDSGVMDVPGGLVGAGSMAAILVLDVQWTLRARGRGRMASSTDLVLGLLVGREHEVVSTQRPPLPDPLVEIKDAACFGGEVGVAREDPAASRPGANRVGVKPAPNGRAGGLGCDAAADDVAAQFLAAQPRQGQAQIPRQTDKRGP